MPIKVLLTELYIFLVALFEGAKKEEIYYFCFWGGGGCLHQLQFGEKEAIAPY